MGRFAYNEGSILYRRSCEQFVKVVQLYGQSAYRLGFNNIICDRLKDVRSGIVRFVRVLGAFHLLFSRTDLFGGIFVSASLFALLPRGARAPRSPALLSPIAWLLRSRFATLHCKTMRMHNPREMTARHESRSSWNVTRAKSL